MKSFCVALWLMICMIPLSWSQQKPFIYHETGLVVDAYFIGLDETNCIETTVHVSAEYAPKIQNPVPVTSTWAGTFVTIGKYDYCSSTQLMYADSGVVGISTSDLLVDTSLKAATMKTAVPLCDATMGCFTLNIDLAWVANGPLREEERHSITHTTTAMFKEHFVGTLREATASGTATVNGINILPGTQSVAAATERARWGSMTVQKNF